MKFVIGILAVCLGTSVFCANENSHIKTEVGAMNPIVCIQTNMGSIVIELYPKKAPVTVKNFLRYVEDGFYNGTIFHRVINRFMIQGGGFTENYKKKKTFAPIKNEADNGLKNEVGTIAMARTSDPNSATAQFFINTANNTFLNYTAPDANGWGYAVFGKVIKGMDVVDKIEKVKTGRGGPFNSDVPEKQIVIKYIYEE
jgi:peptidyl-prolyl cis-trans isomerase B (cyclophilin B)